jgi:hypothetical protein
MKNPIAKPMGGVIVVNPMDEKFEFTENHTMENLLKRAVVNARPFRGTGYRWACVAAVFSCTPATAKGLCKHFGLDANKGVTR